jgi:hypothetical protein
MDFIFNSSKPSHKKSSSVFTPVPIKSNTHKRGFSISSPTSPEERLAPKVNSFSFYIRKPKNNGFLNVLDEALEHFTYKQRELVIGEDLQKVRIKNLELERERMKVDNSKLQIALAQARAKGMVYKTKIKSLKNYCKILEVNNLNRLSKTMLENSQVAAVRRTERRKTVQPVTSKSSDTEFECSNSVYNKN